MKKVIVAVLLVVLVGSGLLTGCVSERGGSGNLDTQEFNFNDFTRVEIGDAFEVELVQAGSFGVSITADDNLYKYIQISKEGETLKIGLEMLVVRPLFTTLRAEITMPELYELDFSGATRGTVKGFSSSNDLILDISGASRVNMSDIIAGDIDFEISGASEVKGDLTAGDADFDVSGASTVQLQGSAKDMRIEASGGSRVELDNFPVNNADVELSGASRGTVNLDGRLDADLSGASKLNYIGEPTMGDIHTSGGSSLNKK